MRVGHQADNLFTAPPKMVQKGDTPLPGMGEIGTVAGQNLGHILRHQPFKTGGEAGKAAVAILPPRQAEFRHRIRCDVLQQGNRRKITLPSAASKSEIDPALCPGVWTT